MDKKKNEAPQRHYSMAEEAGLEEAELYHALFDRSPDGIVILDEQGRIVEFNEAAHRQLGYTREEFKGLRLSDIESGRPSACIDRVMEQGTEELTAGHRTKTGELRDVQVITRPITIKGRSFFHAVWRDVTGYKRAEATLRAAMERASEEKAKSEAIIAALGDSLVIVDTNFRIVFQNRVDRDLIGDMTGQICYQAYEGGSGICEDCPVQPAIADGQVHRAVRTVTTKAGKMHLAITASPLRDASGRIIGVIEMVRDITEQKELEEELWKHRERLMHLVDDRTAELRRTDEVLRTEISKRERIEEELIKAQRLESLGVLAGGIAHDFNNLLTTILGNISLAMLDLEVDHPSLNQLEHAERASIRAQDLTQQLLTFAKGGNPIRRTASIPHLIREAVSFALRGSRTHCDFSAQEDVWLADIDEGQISQVIHNLVINADQAMPQGGTITIRCENAVVEAEQGTLVPAGRYVKITVRDNGIGIIREHLGKIFDPYFTTKQRGSGLGLATTYAIIQKHEGSISVESEPGRGTIFTILLPASSGVVTEKKAEEKRVIRASGKILVMDDEEEVRETTGEALRRCGYSVVFAEEGGRAIELYRQALQAGEPFDAVIMDLTIPEGMGGQEAIGHLLRIDPNVRAVVSSGYSNDPVMANFGSYGFAGVVIKPYRVQELSETMYRVTTNAGKSETGDGSVPPRS